MSDDDLLRLGVTAAGVSLLTLGIQQARAYLATKKAKTGRGLAERLGYRLGKFWPGRHGT